MKSVQIYEGDWMHWCKTGDLLQCCDCALVHRVDARIINRRIQLRFVRDESETKADRRRKRIRLVKLKTRGGSNRAQRARREQALRFGAR